MDWGSAAPFSVGWWAVVSDEYPVGSARLPRGALVRYREWYGASSPNVGLKMVAEDVGRAIAEREGDELVRYGVLEILPLSLRTAGRQSPSASIAT